MNKFLKVFVLSFALLLFTSSAFAATKIHATHFNVTLPFSVNITDLYTDDSCSFMTSNEDFFSFSAAQITDKYYKNNRAKLPENINSDDFLSQWKNNIINDNKQLVDKGIKLVYIDTIPIKTGLIFIQESANTKTGKPIYTVHTYHITNNIIYRASAVLLDDESKDDAINLGNVLIESIYPK